MKFWKRIDAAMQEYLAKRGIPLVIEDNDTGGEIDDEVSSLFTRSPTTLGILADYTCHCHHCRAYEDWNETRF